MEITKWLQRGLQLHRPLRERHPAIGSSPSGASRLFGRAPRGHRRLRRHRHYLTGRLGGQEQHGQYGPGRGPDGQPAPGYREEPSVPPQSTTETFAAVKLYIDNWRWLGVPIYLRSGKRLWKRGTEIIVQLKNPPDVVFRGTPVESLEPNRLIFHIQPDQGIELPDLVVVAAE